MCDLERRVRLAKANVESMCSTMAGWSKTPLYKRKGDKKDSLLNLEVNLYTVTYFKVLLQMVDGWVLEVPPT